MVPFKTPGWYVISLRPQGEHAALRRAAARHGAGVLALSPWRLRGRDDDATRSDLQRALDCTRVLFTSPAAVRFAARLQPLRARGGQVWIAVGSGTAAALRRAGIDRVVVPERMDSEGLLALPTLQALQGDAIGLVSAPQGRDLLATQLRERGAPLRRADVYERVVVALPASALARLRRLPAPAVIALSSGLALQQVLTQLPADLRARFQALPVVAASARLAELAREVGFANVHRAAGPRPAQLASAAAGLSSRGFR